MSDNYTPLVTIPDIARFDAATHGAASADAPALGDSRDGRLYQYTPTIKLSVNIALATGRPLLVLGPSGCGKSSLAHNLARIMDRRYYEYVVTSRSQARDLHYRFDGVRRLGDAHLRQPQPTEASANDTDAAAEERVWMNYGPYVEPGPLWWIYDRACALRRGRPGKAPLPAGNARDPQVWSPEAEGRPAKGSLLLIDEIDKAEPDFPNNLLVPLGAGQFTVEELSHTVRRQNATMDDPLSMPFMIITSNQERQLPDAFVRRCIVLKIEPPTTQHLISLAEAVFGRSDPIFNDIATLMEKHQGAGQLSAAEYLDAVKAAIKLKATDEAGYESIIKHSAWHQIPA